MALTSPGVQVTVIDESFYTPAEPGTTPLIIVATAQDKTNAAGTATAAGTTLANAGKAFKMTSQRDLVDTFGVPFFEKTASGTPVHGSERNEYGLLAAYSLLGVSNSAFIVRANVDLDQLEPLADAPGAEPTNGKWWVNAVTTTYGIFEWDSAAVSAGGQTFTSKIPLVLTDDDSAKLDGSNKPLGSVGSIGDYAVVFRTVVGAESADAEYGRIYFKSAGNGAGVGAGTWVLLGSQDWMASHPVVVGSEVPTGGVIPEANFEINTSVISVGEDCAATLTDLATYITENIDGVTAKVIKGSLALYSNGATSVAGDSTKSGAINIVAGTVATAVGITAGTYLQPKLTQSPHTSVPVYKKKDLTAAPVSAVNGYPTGSVWIKTTEPGSGARFRVSKYSSATKAWASISAPLYASGHAANYYLDRSGGGANIPVDSIYVQTNATEAYSFTTPAPGTFDTTFETAEFRVWRRANTGNTVITSDVVASQYTALTEYTFSIRESLPGELTLADAIEVSFTAAHNSTDAVTIATAINAAGFEQIGASVTADDELQIYHKTGGEFRLIDGTGTPLNNIFTAYNIETGSGAVNLYADPTGTTDAYLATNWAPLAIEDFAAQGAEPLNEPADGQLWFNQNYSEVDIMVHNGQVWVGYRNANGGFEDTNSTGPQVAASAPTTQGDGTALVTGDLWISTADMENFPTIYRYNDEAIAVEGYNARKWVLVDKTDQITEEGILFADARWGATGAADQPALIEDLTTSNYVDPDSPDPALYPKGMLLWNTRRSGGNVKKYMNGYINTSTDNDRYNDTFNDDGLTPTSGDSMSGYWTDRWVTASPNNEDGSGTFGRKAQRAVVVAAIKSVIDTSEEARDEERRNFNLIAAPGYPEAYSNLVNLNIDRGVTAFVLGDTPLRLKSNATEIINWGTNARTVTDNGDAGLVTYDEYSALWYPNGYTTDLSGTAAVVPASHMMLKTIALSDQVSYPWFAPAGTRRGGITNATSVGYIDALSGEFQTVALNEGMRDVLYDLKVNPIPFFVGVGHVAFGQKTRARNASALDRINVARLVVYLRSQLNKLARPYLFEPNDKITRDEIKGAVESLLLELVGLRALYDFAVVCDETNNTPARIDRNELWVDIAIEPVKAVEFIYIPLRVKNTGEI